MVPDRTDRSARPGICALVSPVRRAVSGRAIRSTALSMRRDRGSCHVGRWRMDYRDPYAGLGLDDTRMRKLVRIVALLRVASQGDGGEVSDRSRLRSSIYHSRAMTEDQPGPEMTAPHGCFSTEIPEPSRFRRVRTDIGSAAGRVE